MPDLFNLNLPTIGKKGTVEQRLEKLEAYLINLTEQLRFTLANLDPEDNFSTTALQVYTSTSKGEKGSPGKSAYQYAVEQGYEGNETEFAQSLAGISDMETDISQVQSSLVNLGTNVASLQNDLQELDTDVGNINTEISGIETTIENILERLAQAEEDIAQLQGGQV